MTDLWGFLLQTLTASLVALFLLALKQIFMDKLSPRWQYGVWAILALRLVIPAGLGRRSIFLPLAKWLEYARFMVERRLDSALADPWTPICVTAPAPLLTLTPPVSVTDWLFYLYAAGMLGLGAWFVFCYVRLRRSLNTPAAPERTEQVNRICLHYGLLPPARVVESAGAETAFVCGPLRPVLVLPAGKAVDDKVLLHELLHLKHGDLWLNTLVCIFRCLHWCNPFLWLVFNRVGNDGEALCDQRVLERLEGEERRDYGRILLGMADERYARAPGTSSMANGSRNIAARIQSIARFKRFPRGMALVSLCMAAALGFACLWGAPAAAVELPEGNCALEQAITAARINRPTTLAGALDTYAKGILYNNGIYLAAVSTPEEQAQLYQQMASNPADVPYYHLDSGVEGRLTDDGFTSFFLGDGPYYILSLQETAPEQYTCWCLFPCSGWDEDSGEQVAWLHLRRLEVRLDARYGWLIQTVEAIRQPSCQIVDAYLDSLPGFDYTVETDQWRFTYHWVVTHCINSSIQTESSLDTVSRIEEPQLHAQFSESRQQYQCKLELLRPDGQPHSFSVSGQCLYDIPEDYVPTGESLPPLPAEGTSSTSSAGTWSFTETNSAGVAQSGGGGSSDPAEPLTPDALEVHISIDGISQGVFLLSPEVAK